MNEKITLQDIIDLLVQRQNIAKKDAETFVKAMFDLIEEVLEREKYLKVKGLGVFKLIKVESRKSINVNTGERFEIQGHSKISFTPDSTVRALINKPFAHFETVSLNEDTVLEDTFESIESVSNDSEEDSENTDVLESPQTQEESEEVIDRPDGENGKPEKDKIISQPIKEESGFSQKADRDLPKEVEEVAEALFDASLDEKLESGKEELKSENTVGDGLGPDKPDTKVRKGWYVFLVLLCVSVLVGYLLYKENKTAQNPDSSSVQNTDMKPNSEIVSSKSLVVDTLSADSAKTGQIGQENHLLDKKEDMKTEDAAVKKETTGKPLSSKVEYNMVGILQNHTINSGETLRKISLKYYGTKELSSYIVRYNSDIIKNPDNVPVGTVIKIPELKQK